MSLAMWLPLNGDLHNQGLADITVTNNGATVDNNGKIGQCYSFNGNNNYLYASYNFYNSRYSVCAWIYTTSSSATQTIICDRTTVGCGFSIFLIGGKLRIDCGGNSLQWTTAYTYPINTWFHLTVTYDGNIVYYYINGEFKEKKAQTLASSYWGTITSIGASQMNGSGYGNYLNGKLNDVRIYGHALSAKEVEEIAKGLVLHYKLDNNGLGGNNLTLNSYKLNVTATKTNLYISKRGSSTLQVRQDGFTEVKCTASWQGLSFWENQLNLTVGTKLTYSFYIYCSGNSRAFSFYPMMYNSAGTRDTSTGIPISLDGGNYTTVNSKAFTATTATTPEFHYVTFEWNQAVSNIISNGGSIELSIQVHGTWNTGDWACVFAPKLEYGEVPTRWSPAPADLGLDTSIIYDSSGYGNNGTIIGNLTIDSNSPRYGVSTNLATTSSHIATTTLTTAGFTNSYSISWWGNVSTYSGRMMWGFTNGNRLNGIYNGNFWNTGDGANNPLYQPGTTTPVSAPTVNIWHHFVMVGDGTTCKVYKDGELWGQAKTYKSLTGTIIYFNGWANATNYTLENTKLSDFRIYATALTPEQVKELYSTSMSIDNNGNIHARELIVEDTNNTSTNKRGQLLVNTAEEEATIASFIKPNKIECDNLYEY